MTQNDLEHYEIKGTPPYVLIVSLNPIFRPIMLYDQPLSRYNISKCTNYPQNDIDHVHVPVELKCHVHA